MVENVLPTVIDSAGYPPPPGGFGPGGYPPGQPGAYGAGAPGGAGQGGPRKPITGSPETIALHAITIDPRTGLPRGETPPASTAAVVALVCGILLCLPLAGIPAIIAGLIGRRAAREQPNSVGGASMSLAGILLGAFNLLLSAIGLVVFIVSVLG